MGVNLDFVVAAVVPGLLDRAELWQLRVGRVLSEEPIESIGVEGRDPVGSIIAAGRLIVVFSIVVALSYQNLGIGQVLDHKIGHLLRNVEQLSVARCAKRWFRWRLEGNRVRHVITGQKNNVQVRVLRAQFAEKCLNRLSGWITRELTEVGWLCQSCRSAVWPAVSIVGVQGVIHGHHVQIRDAGHLERLGGDLRGGKNARKEFCHANYYNLLSISVGFWGFGVLGLLGAGSKYILVFESWEHGTPHPEPLNNLWN